jgi:UDP-glucuronate 4-epimerase
VTRWSGSTTYYSVRLKQDRIAALLAAGERVRFVPCNFADEAALARATDETAFDRIVHLGAQAGVRHSIDNPLAYGRANLNGHLNILELGRARGVGHLVYASSSSVYGNSGEGPLSVDRRVDQPISLYAATKRADELMSEAYAHLYRLPQTGLRFFTVYGPWGRPDMAAWLFTSAILEGRPIAVFNGGSLRRDFTYIDDIVVGVLAALDRPPADNGQAKPGGSAGPHALYNIGNGKPEQLSRFIDVLEEACGSKAIRDLKPMQPGDVAATFADIDDMRRDFGYDPAVGIEVGVPRFVRWYRDYTRT